MTFEELLTSIEAASTPEDWVYSNVSDCRVNPWKTAAQNIAYLAYSMGKSLADIEREACQAFGYREGYRDCARNLKCEECPGIDEQDLQIIREIAYEQGYDDAVKGRPSKVSNNEV